MAKQSDLNKLHKKRSKFLTDRELALTKRVGTLEGKLFQLIVDDLLSKVEVSGGVITRNAKNIKLTAAVGSIFKRFNKNFNSEVLASYVKDIQGGLSLSNQYFEGFTTKSKFEGIRKRSNTIVMGRLGVDPKGKLTSGGFLDGFLNDSAVKNRVAAATARNITAGNSISVFRDELKTIIKGAPDAAGGALSSQYRTFINDTYHQVDRQYNTLIADEIGLTAFIYSGTRIKTTRRFCCQRNGHTFTKKESELWKKIPFQGKPKSGYNPLTDMGGFNCRHNVQYISNEEAARRRPDLEIRNEKLVKKKGGKPPKLSQC